MGLFNKMASAPVFGRGRWHVPGKFVEEIFRIQAKESARPTKNGAMQLIGEHSVLEFNGTTYQSVEGTKPTVDTTKEFKTGDTVTNVVDLGNAMYGKGNAKEYMAAVYQAYKVQRDGVPCTYAQAMEFMSTTEGEAFAERLVLGEESKKVPGLILKVECWNTTKNNGTEDFTAKRFCAFSDVPEGAEAVA